MYGLKGYSFGDIGPMSTVSTNGQRLEIMGAQSRKEAIVIGAKYGISKRYSSDLWYRQRGAKKKQDKPVCDYNFERDYYGV